jgi:Domain of unknown function (DUF3859)
MTEAARGCRVSRILWSALAIATLSCGPRPSPASTALPSASHQPRLAPASAPTPKGCSSAEQQAAQDSPLPAGTGGTLIIDSGEYGAPDGPDGPKRVKRGPVTPQLGTVIGFTWMFSEVTASGVVPLRVEIRHPGLTDPHSSKRTHLDVRQETVPIKGLHWATWTFDQPWQLVPGMWSIDVYYQCALIAGTVFRIENP